MLPDGSGLIDLHVGWLPGTEYWCGGTYSYHGFHMYRLVASGTGVVVLWPGVWGSFWVACGWPAA